MGSWTQGGRRAERGNALILAVFILLALTSVGVVSVQRTNTDLMVAGNVARATRAHMASEAGMIHAIYQVGNNPQYWLLKMISAASPASPLEVASYSTALVTAGTQFQIPTVEGSTELARLQQDLAYRARTTHIDEVPGPQGNDLNRKDFCYQVFDFESEGGIPTRTDESVDDTMDQTDTVVVRNRARAVAGPTACHRR